MKNTAFCDWYRECSRYSKACGRSFAIDAILSILLLIALFVSIAAL